jgi:hypothetical protein
MFFYIQAYLALLGCDNLEELYAFVCYSTSLFLGVNYYKLPDILFDFYCFPSNTYETYFEPFGLYSPFLQ